MFDLFPFNFARKPTATPKKTKKERERDEALLKSEAESLLKQKTYTGAMRQLLQDIIDR